MSWVKEYTRQCLAGAGQVMLQNSRVAGAMFLLSIIMCDRTIIALSALAALLVATAIGRNHQGLSGFNAMLVGCAAFALFNNGIAISMLMLAAAVLTLPIKRLLDALTSRIGTSSFTLPFIFATWLLIATAPLLGATPYQPEAAAEIPAMSTDAVAVGIFKGLSQVFLIESRVTGILIALGLLCTNNIRAAMWAPIGSALGMGFAAACGCEWSEIAAGLWGFSPALTAIALAGRRPAVIMAAIATTVMLQLLLTPALAAINLPTLTLPFCVATIAFTAKPARNPICISQKK